jgi:hypothetical protein
MRAFQEADKLESNVDKMPSVFSTDVIKGMHDVLVEQLGKKPARKAMERMFWDSTFNRPDWHPERFNITNDELGKHYHDIFKELIPFITMYERFKKEYGDERAQIITAQLAVPASVPYLAKVFKSIDDFTDIDQFRQLLANYLGDGEGFDWTEKVSEDHMEVKYRFTRCVYIEILRGYGMDSAAASTCYCDHIIFDNAMPELYFRRDHCKGVGDNFCDHDFRVRTPADTKQNDQRHGDTDKAFFDAKAMIENWRANYVDNGDKFKW